MIQSLMAGPNIQVDNGMVSMPFIPNNPANPLQGMLRANGSGIEVFNGSNWTMVSAGVATVSLNGSAQSAINWALNKMAEEARINTLAEKHPAVADAVNTVNEAYDRLKVVVALTAEENK
jgi:hypothetical protein